MSETRTYLIDFFAKDPDGEDYTDQVGHSVEITESLEFIQGVLLRAASIGHELKDVLSIVTSEGAVVGIDVIPVGKSVQVESLLEAKQFVGDEYDMFLNLGQGMRHFSFDLYSGILYGFEFCANNLELESQFSDPDYLFMAGQDIDNLSEHLKEGEDLAQAYVAGETTKLFNIEKFDTDLTIQEIAQYVIDSTTETARFASETLATVERTTHVHEEAKVMLAETKVMLAETEAIRAETKAINAETQRLLQRVADKRKEFNTDPYGAEDDIFEPEIYFLLDTATVKKMTSGDGLYVRKPSVE